MGALPRSGPVPALSERLGLLHELIGALMLLVGAGGEPVGALTDLAAVLATATQHPEVLIDGLPVPGAARVPLGPLTLTRRLVLEPRDLAGGLGRVAVHDRAQPVAFLAQLCELVTLTPSALLTLLTAVRGSGRLAFAGVLARARVNAT